MKSRMARIYFTAIYTASVFLTINSLGFNLVGAFGLNSTIGNTPSAELTNIQMPNYDKVTIVPPSHSLGQATVVVAVNVNQDAKSKNVPHDLIVTAIGINGGAAVIPVSQASGPVILKINPGPFMIGEKQDSTNDTKFGAEFNGDCQPISDETFKSTNAAYGTVLDGQTKSCTVAIKFVEQ
jgi:hypothetical protein